MKMKFIRQLYEIFISLRLLHKLLISYFALIIIPLCLISFLFYNNVAQMVEKNVTYSAEQSFEQTYSFLSYKINNIFNKSNSFLINNHVIEILENSSIRTGLLETMADMNELTPFLLSLEDKTDIFRVRLYMSDSLLYSKDGKNIYSINYIEKSKWMNVMKESSKSTLWLPSSYFDGDDTPLFSPSDLKSAETLSLAKNIPNPRDYSVSIGIIRFDFTKKSIVDILNKANTINNSFTYIINSRGDLVATSSIPMMLKFKMIETDQSGTVLTPVSKGYLTLNDEKVLTNSRQINNTDWTMVTVIPFGEILSESNTVKNIILVLVLAIGTAAYALAYIISYSITKRLSQLAGKMRNFHKSEFKSMDKPRSTDEIGMLINDYNYMTEKISDLIDEQYQLGQELKNTELKALQAQINPHFLYNTLDLINWYAWKNKGPEIISVVETLAKFYKLSLSHGEDIVTIRDELAHASYYFQIQNRKFKNVIELQIEVSNDIQEYGILKITLQPIIENAIFHGIMGKEEQKGVIRIEGRFSGSDILLTVSDDGIGITEEKLSGILNSTSTSFNGSGYGLKNINDRLKLNYGKKYGLTFKSENGKGTTVEVLIPSVKMNVPEK